MGPGLANSLDPAHATCGLICVVAIYGAVEVSRVVGLLFIRRWCKYSAHVSREFISAGISVLHVCILDHLTLCERLAAIKVKVARRLECATVGASTCILSLNLF